MPHQRTRTRRHSYIPRGFPSNTFTICLHDITIIRTPLVVENVIRNAYIQMVREAGRRLVITRGGTGDVSLYFEPHGYGSRPCGVLILGDEGGGGIYVGAHEDLRVCGNEENTRERHVFRPQEIEFGRFLGNTCVHEIGHITAGLGHSVIPSNFMFAGNIPKCRRTLRAMRFHWAGIKTFFRDQRSRIITAIRTGTALGNSDPTIETQQP